MERKSIMQIEKKAENEKKEVQQKETMEQQ